jgi:hypothetical protein
MTNGQGAGGVNAGDFQNAQAQQFAKAPRDDFRQHCDAQACCHQLRNRIKAFHLHPNPRLNALAARRQC